MNCDDELRSPFLEDIQDGSTERLIQQQKKLKSNRFNLERNSNNGSKTDTNDFSTNNIADDKKKAELLQQLKAIEEAIARKQINRTNLTRKRTK